MRLFLLLVIPYFVAAEIPVARVVEEDSTAQAVKSVAKTFAELQRDQMWLQHSIESERERTHRERARFEMEMEEARLKVEKPEVWHVMMETRRAAEAKRLRENEEFWQSFKTTIMWTLGIGTILWLNSRF